MKDSFVKKVYCIFWKEGLNDPNKKMWSVHRTKEDARKFARNMQGAVHESYGDYLPIEKEEWVMVSEVIYKDIRRAGDGCFVDECEVASIQLSLFKEV